LLLYTMRSKQIVSQNKYFVIFHFSRRSRRAYIQRDVFPSMWKFYKLKIPSLV